MSTVPLRNLELSSEELDLCARSETVQAVLANSGRVQLVQQPEGAGCLLANPVGLELLMEAFAAEANRSSGSHETIFAGLYHRALTALESLTLEELNSEEPLRE